MKKINPIDDYEEIARFKNNVDDMSAYDWGTNSSDIKKLREENGFWQKCKTQDNWNIPDETQVRLFETEKEVDEFIKPIPQN